jgi:hypothetical protein
MNGSRGEAIGRKIEEPPPHPAAMAGLSPDTLLDTLRWRYAVKGFDPSRALDQLA